MAGLRFDHLPPDRFSPGRSPSGCFPLEPRLRDANFPGRSHHARIYANRACWDPYLGEALAVWDYYDGSHWDVWSARLD